MTKAEIMKVRNDCNPVSDTMSIPIVIKTNCRFLNDYTLHNMVTDAKRHDADRDNVMVSVEDRFN